MGPWDQDGLLGSLSWYVIAQAELEFSLTIHSVFYSLPRFSSSLKLSSLACSPCRI